ncbi:unnamed protein product, partial [Mesorhabditis belari]|uniref:Uncharacterized protein n=1 Tax=Mesorhabditis belari TaxID=2138241 RepID=A0AAF3FBI7_9BILA
MCEPLILDAAFALKIQSVDITYTLQYNLVCWPSLRQLISYPSYFSLSSGVLGAGEIVYFTNYFVIAITILDISLVLSAFYNLSKQQTFMSESTQKLKWKWFRNLLIQVIVVLTLYFVPFSWYRVIGAGERFWLSGYTVYFTTLLCFHEVESRTFVGTQ